MNSFTGSYWWHIIMYLILGGSFVYSLLVESRRSTGLPFERRRPTSCSLPQVNKKLSNIFKNEECYEILILVHIMPIYRRHFLQHCSKYASDYILVSRFEMSIENIQRFDQKQMSDQVLNSVDTKLTRKLRCNILGGVCVVLGWRQAWRYSGKGLLAEEPSFSSSSSLSGEAAPSLSVLK